MRHSAQLPTGAVAQPADWPSVQRRMVGPRSGRYSAANKRAVVLLVGPSLPTPPVSTISEALAILSASEADWLTVHCGTTRTPFSGRSVVDLARRWAFALRAAGVRPGDRVLVLLPNDERFVASFFGIILAGAVPVPLPWPLSDAGSALLNLAPRIAHADARAAVTVPELADRAPISMPCVTSPDRLALLDDMGQYSTSTAFIQYTSGSLGNPRGAVISQRAAIASAQGMATALGLGAGDVAVTWLPLFHDMGLVGTLLTPLITGFPVHLQSPGEFLLHPGRWLRLISEVGGTIVAAPDFAWRLVLRRVASAAPLPTLKHALNGAEPVHRATLDGIKVRLGIHLKPVYGLAENTLGDCFSDGLDPDVGVGGREVVSAGSPIPGVAVRVMAGEIQVRGATQMDEYFRDPESTAAAIQDGWLRTGDLGEIHSGRLYVAGREKDLVIQNGTKFHPYDIERVAADAAGAPPNGVAAFADPTTEALVVVIESRLPDALLPVRAALVARLGVRVDRMIQVLPGEIPRTSSGKIQRRQCARQWAEA